MMPAVRKTSLLIITLIALQLAVLLGGLWLSVSLRSDCAFASGPSPFMNWRCTTSGDPTLVPLIAFAVLPPLFAKTILAALGQRISWKRAVLTHIITALAVWTLLMYGEDPRCGCGG